MHVVRTYTGSFEGLCDLQLNAGSEGFMLSREDQLGRDTTGWFAIGEQVNNKAKCYLMNFNCPCWETNPSCEQVLRVIIKYAHMIDPAQPKREEIEF